MKWDVWFVTYATYPELATTGDIPQRLVRRWLSFAAAQHLVDELGFGYCMKPAVGAAQ